MYGVNKVLGIDVSEKILFCCMFIILSVAVDCICCDFL